MARKVRGEHEHVNCLLGAPRHTNTQLHVVGVCGRKVPEILDGVFKTVFVNLRLLPSSPVELTSFLSLATPFPA